MVPFNSFSHSYSQSLLNAISESSYQSQMVSSITMPSHHSSNDSVLLKVALLFEKSIVPESLSSPSPEKVILSYIMVLKFQLPIKLSGSFKLVLSSQALKINNARILNSNFLNRIPPKRFIKIS